MKKIIVIVSVLFLSNTCMAQWVHMGIWGMGENVTYLGVGNNHLFSSFYNVGRFDTTFGGDWVPANTGMTIGSDGITCFATIGSILFAGGDNTGVYSSTNNGSEWINPAPPFTGVGANVLAALGTTLFAGGGGIDSGVAEYGIYQSNDSGKTWFPKFIGGTFQAMTASGNFVLEGDAFGAILSTDGGATFHSSGLTQESALGVAITGTTLWAGTKSGHIRKSVDNGQTWTVAWNADTASKVSVTSFATSGSLLFAGTIGEGVLESTDSGANWTKINEGLLEFGILVNINALAIYDSSLVCATDHGVASRPLLELQPKSAVAEIVPTLGFSLSIYPNPASSLAAIQYSVPASTSVTILISDVLGRQIAVPILHQTEDAGNHEAEFDASNLQPGIYWCRLMTGTAERSEKMLIQK